MESSIKTSPVRYEFLFCKLEMGHKTHFEPLSVSCNIIVTVIAISHSFVSIINNNRYYYH